jgi:hypothetical protein
MSGTQIAASIEKTIKDTLSQPQSLLLAADKVFKNLPSFIQPKFNKVVSGTTEALSAVSKAKVEYDTVISNLNKTTGTVSGGGKN